MNQPYLSFNPQREIAALGGIGILTEADLRDLKGGRRRVYELMKNGFWYSREEVCAAAGGSEGLRRMRELRKYYEVEKKRLEGRRCWIYRLRDKA